jgi:sialic acid synthase SpsE
MVGFEDSGMESVIRIGQKAIGTPNPTFITAEIGINHNGDLGLAQEMIRAAARVGVDAVKFQAFRAESFVSKRTEKAGHQRSTLAESESTYDMWKRLEFSAEDFRVLKGEADRHGLVFLSSAFDDESLAILASLDVPAYKIASGDVTHLPFIRAIAALKRPIILSVGMATLAEIVEAIDTIHAQGNREIILLQCTALYPAPMAEVNLLKIKKIQAVFGIPVGFSDHTTSIWTPAAAVAMGACLIERHFTLDKALPGTDQTMSADPDEMRTLIEGIRAVEMASGRDVIGPTDLEEEGRTLFRRSLIAAENIPRETRISKDMIRIKRPATGIAPRYLEFVLGRVARKDIAADEPITWDAV